jgi:hypothetical protein
MLYLLVLHVHHPFRVSVTEVTPMGRATVNLVLVEGVFDFVGENTCGEAGDEFLCLVRVSRMKHVVVDENVFPH